MSPRLPALLAALLLSIAAAWAVPNASLVGFTADGRLITGSRSSDGRQATSLTLRNVATGASTGLLLFPEAGRNLGLLAVTPDLKSAAWLNPDADLLTVRSPAGHWSVSTPGLRGTWTARFSPDGATLAVGNANGYVQLWDVAGQRRRATLLLRGRPEQLAFRPDNAALAISERYFSPLYLDGSVSLWNVASGARLGSVPGTQGPSRVELVYAPDGRSLLLPVPRFTVGWVDPASGQVRRRLPTVTGPCSAGDTPGTCALGPAAASLSADGRRLAVSVYPRTSPNWRPTVRVYDVATGEALVTLPEQAGVGTLSPDGRVLIERGWQGQQAVLVGVVLPR